MARLLWQQRQDIGPAPRYGSAAVFVLPTSKTLLWGGLQEKPGGWESVDDTWEWDGSGWVQVADTGPAPLGLGFARMAFDLAREVAVFFRTSWGGSPSETWEWDGENWTQVEDTGPQPLQNAFQLVYDAARKATILEAGAPSSATGSYTPVGTWQWDGVNWTQVADVGPPARRYSALAYDSLRKRVVLFGGRNLDSSLEPDTWEWDGNTWEQITNIGPTPRVAHAMAGTSLATLLFGGMKSTFSSSSADLLRDTWAWDGKYWHQRQDMGPSPRFGHTLSWDSVRQRGVLFGGGTVPPGTANTLAFLGDTWEAFEQA